MHFGASLNTLISLITLNPLLPFSAIFNSLLLTSLPFAFGAVLNLLNHLKPPIAFQRLFSASISFTIRFAESRNAIASAF